MARIKYIAIALHLLVLVAAAETASRFFVPAKQVAHLKKVYGEQAVRRLNSLLLLMENLVESSDQKKILGVNRFSTSLNTAPTWQHGKRKITGQPPGILGKGQGTARIMPWPSFSP